MPSLRSGGLALRLDVTATEDIIAIHGPAYHRKHIPLAIPIPTTAIFLADCTRLELDALIIRARHIGPPIWGKVRYEGCSVADTN